MPLLVRTAGEAAWWAAKQGRRRRPHPARTLVTLIREFQSVIVVATATGQLCRDNDHEACRRATPETFTELAEWAARVWSLEHQTAPLWVQSEDDLPSDDVGLDLRRPDWGRPQGWWDDGPEPGQRTGILTGTSGPVARIALDPQAHRVDVLHEVGHLLQDGQHRFIGHEAAWQQCFEGLLRRHTDDDLADRWLVLRAQARTQADAKGLPDLSPGRQRDVEGGGTSGQVEAGP